LLERFLVGGGFAFKKEESQGGFGDIIPEGEAWRVDDRD
jgi:hypothetical protein